MIFVANQNGSHNPREEMKLEDFMQGVKLLWKVAEGFDTERE
jgi:N-carbamoyl-L-amino-acid hydrolase